MQTTEILKHINKRLNTDIVKELVEESYVDMELVEAGDEEETRRRNEIYEEVQCIEMDGERENYSFNQGYSYGYEAALKELRLLINENI